MKLRKTLKQEKQAVNQQLVKESNLTLIFSLINKHEPVSRAELANITGLSPTTVSSLTEELLDSGMVIETGTGTTTTSGRKPIMLEVNPQGGYVISVEMVEEGFNLCIYNLKCDEISGNSYVVSNYDAIGQEIVKVIDRIINDTEMQEEKLLGICLGIPGILDKDNNRVISSTVLPINEANDFYNILKDRFESIPVLVENESSFSAYAEKEFGVNGDIKNLVRIDINTGIGSGVVVDRKIFTGSFGLAGEIGHVSIDMNGPRCKCGNRGCLEVLASIPALCQRVIFAMMSGRETVIKGMVDNDYNRIDIEVVKKALDIGDELAVEVVDEIASKLAFGINNVINIFNPQVVVIGGKIKALGDYLVYKIKERLDIIGLKPGIRNVEVCFSSLENNTVTLGGARYVLDNIFKASTPIRGNLLGV